MEGPKNNVAEDDEFLASGARCVEAVSVRRRGIEVMFSIRCRGLGEPASELVETDDPDVLLERAMEPKLGKMTVLEGLLG